MTINKRFESGPDVETLALLGLLAWLVSLVWLVTLVKKILPGYSDGAGDSGKTRGFRVRFPVGPLSRYPCESVLLPISWTEKSVTD